MAKKSAKCVPFYTGRLQAMHCPSIDRPEPGYDLEESRRKLIEGFQSIIDSVKYKPPEIMPQTFLSFEMTIHPERTDVKNYPRALLKYLRLRCLSQYHRQISPRRYFSDNPDPSLPATVLILCGREKFFKEIPKKLKNIWPLGRANHELANIEYVRAIEPKSRLKMKAPPVSDSNGGKNETFEAVLSSLPNGYSTLDEFRAYAESIGFTISTWLELKERGDKLVRLHGPRAALEELAEFQFIRSIGYISNNFFRRIYRPESNQPNQPAIR